MWIPLPSQLDTRCLEKFLEQQSIERWQRELLVQDVVTAVCGYGQCPERSELRDDLEGMLKAAKKLEKAIPKLGTDRFVQLYAAFARTNPPSPPNFLDNERVRALHGIENQLQKLIAGTKNALKELSKYQGRPHTPERIFVDSLAKAWAERTGNKPTFSGKMDFKSPSTPFAKFVKVSSEMIDAQKDFEIGFDDLIRRVCGKVA